MYNGRNSRAQKIFSKEECEKIINSPSQLITEDSKEAIKKALKHTWKFEEYEDSCATSGLENFRAVKTREKKNETS